MRSKILLVDDNEALRAGFGLWFPEFEVRTAASAEEALALLAKPNDLDLIILDVQLPGMSGLEALQKIKAAAPRRRVVIMTGFSTKDTAIHALTAHADNYIEKPFDNAAMRGLIEKEVDTARGEGHLETTDAAGKVEHVKRYIENNLFGKVTLASAAAAVYLTPKYLSRVFKQKTGISFNQFKLGLKMDLAKTLLRSHENSVKCISGLLGYANAESFIREFSKIAGKSPSAFRSSSAEDQAACQPGPRRRADGRKHQPR